MSDNIGPMGRQKSHGTSFSSYQRRAQSFAAGPSLWLPEATNVSGLETPPIGVYPAQGQPAVESCPFSSSTGIFRPAPAVSRLAGSSPWDKSLARGPEKEHPHLGPAWVSTGEWADKPIHTRPTATTCSFIFSAGDRIEGVLGGVSGKVERETLVEYDKPAAARRQFSSSQGQLMLEDLAKDPYGNRLLRPEAMHG